MKIFKYPLTVGDNEISMPEGSAVLCVQVQNEIPCIWAKVDPQAPFVTRRFRTYGTGHVMIDDDVFKHYVGTYQLRNGALVFHVFTDRKEC